MELKRAAIIGGGSFGTVVANILADNQVVTKQWMRNSDVAAQINNDHINPVYLPSVTLNDGLVATTDIEQAVTDADVIFVSVPSKVFRQVLMSFTPYLKPHQALVSTTKGIEPERFLMMSQVLQELCPDNPVGVLSGPNLAKEIARRELAATVIASHDSGLRRCIQESLSCKYFRVYASNDTQGVELSGALKYIYAIVSGFVAALGMGENSKSMIITRSLAEMSRFAVAYGANPLTFLGLAGVGDLVVTCMSPLSRNYRVGHAIGSGMSLTEATESLGETAEGVNTLKFVRNKAVELDIYMPLVMGAYQIIYEGADAKEVAHDLMQGDYAADVEFALSRDEI